jgi:hypothetical protein
MPKSSVRSRENLALDQKDAASLHLGIGHGAVNEALCCFRARPENIALEHDPEKCIPASEKIVPHQDAKAPIDSI